MPRARPTLTDQMRARLASLSEPGPDRMPEAVDEHRSTPDHADQPATVPGADDSAPPRSIIRGFTRTHFVVVAVVVTMAVGFAAWTMLRARDHAVGAEVPITVTSATEVPTRPDEPESTPAPPATIAVHVVGEVSTPGVVELTEGARVADAIAAAGGLTAKAVPGRLNLAQRLHDGEQIFISDASDPPSEVTSGSAGLPDRDPPPDSDAPVNLNTATAEQLESLPGVGPATAQAIIAWRSAHGRFTTVEELQEVDGIGPKTFARLKPLVTI